MYSQPPPPVPQIANGVRHLPAPTGHPSNTLLHGLPSAAISSAAHNLTIPTIGTGSVINHSANPSALLTSIGTHVPRQPTFSHLPQGTPGIAPTPAPLVSAPSATVPAFMTAATAPQPALVSAPTTIASYTGQQQILSAPIQFSVPPPSHYQGLIPATFPAGKVAWPSAYSTQSYQASFQPHLPGFTYPQQTYSGSLPSRPDSPARDRSPVRRERSYSGDSYRGESWYRSEEDGYRRSEERITKDKGKYRRSSQSRESRSRDKDRRRELKRNYDMKKQKEEIDREKARKKHEAKRREKIPVAYKDDVTKGDDEKRSKVKTESRSKRYLSSPERTLSSLPSAQRMALETEKLMDTTKLTHEEIIEMERKVWIRSTPADLYYERDTQNPAVMRSTEKSQKMHETFEQLLIQSGVNARSVYPERKPPQPTAHARHCGGGDSDSSDNDEEDAPNFRAESTEWMEFRSKDPNRLHPDIWQNIPNEVNDGPACRCSKKARETGIRHKIWVGENEESPLDPLTNNYSELFHYRVTISPPTNFLINNPTSIYHDEHEFIFEGFSMFTRKRIPDLPVCQIIRFNIEYSILFFEEKLPENFTIKELQLFHEYFFHELLELWDWDTDQRFFFMPRFVRNLSENGKEILSMNEVLNYLIKSYSPLVNPEDLEFIMEMKNEKWQHYADPIKGMLVTHPGMKPSTIRVDQLDREHDDKSKLHYPEIVHFGLKPPQLCYAGNPDYQRLYREYVKFRHLLANMPKPTFKDKQDLESKEQALQDMRSNIKLKRDTTVVVSSDGFFKTGLMTDIVQHALLLPVLVGHLRFHFSLDHLEEKINFKFQNRSLLQQALTHPSYKENFGTNPDHLRNTLSNCGIRQPEYGDKKIHVQNTRKRGINVLINIMSRFGKKDETESKVKHNERLEFLGDAVVEFITSVHLFYMFPDLEEGGLATFRSAIVLNQNLAELAAALELEKFILFSHGSDLCHDSELRHAMANCFEAFLGAVYLDGGINKADEVFGISMFHAESDLLKIWRDLPHHPLQIQEAAGDRHWIATFPMLQKLVEFEKETGIEFKHIRLLARAFTDRSIGFNNLTLGSNQRLEFLGDTVLQLVTSDFLYKHFPDHHEGHLSLLRASLVNNRTQSVVCDDLGMTRYAAYANPKPEFKVKDKADLLEAFVGALYVDKDLFHCQVFAEVCFFPRLQQFIINQDWNDPKSKLQQCCLTLRTMDGGEPDIPVYKVIECKGPSNTRVYTVAVYFRGERLAKSTGHSIQMAEFNAAKNALEDCAHLFPHLTYQKRVLERSFKNQGLDFVRHNWLRDTQIKREELGLDKPKAEKKQAKEKGSSPKRKKSGKRIDEMKGKRNTAGKKKDERKEPNKRNGEKDLSGPRKEEVSAPRRDERDSSAQRRDERDTSVVRIDERDSSAQRREELERSSLRRNSRDVSVHRRDERDISVQRRGERDVSGHRKDDRDVVAQRRNDRSLSSHKRSERELSNQRRGDDRDSSVQRRDERDMSSQRRDERDAYGNRRGHEYSSSSRLERERKYHDMSGSSSSKESKSHYDNKMSDHQAYEYEMKSYYESDSEMFAEESRLTKEKHRGRRKERRTREKRESGGRARSGRSIESSTERRRESWEGPSHRDHEKLPRSSSKKDEVPQDLEQRSSSRKPRKRKRSDLEKSIEEEENRGSDRQDRVKEKGKSKEGNDRGACQTKKDDSSSDLAVKKDMEKDLVEEDTSKTNCNENTSGHVAVDSDRMKALQQTPSRADGKSKAKGSSENNKDRVQKEIQEIENKLARKKIKEEKSKKNKGKSQGVKTGEEVKPDNQYTVEKEIEASSQKTKQTKEDILAENTESNVIASDEPPVEDYEEKEAKEPRGTNPSQTNAEDDPDSGELSKEAIEAETAKSEYQDSDVEEGEYIETDEEIEEKEKTESVQMNTTDPPSPAEERTPAPSPSKKETQPRTEKETEREEKKKRWRRESPRKRISREAYAAEHRGGSPRSRSRKSKRSLSPRERGKRHRLDHERGYDRSPRYYQPLSPSMYWPAEYYDRSVRSPSRDRYRYYEQSSSSRHYRY